MRNSLRQNVVFICFIIFSVAIIGQLINLQIIQGEKYRAWAQGLYGVSKKEVKDRGEIFLKNGEPLAINKNFFLVFASPAEVTAPEETASVLGPILELSKEFILEKLEGDSLYSPIKKRLSEKEAEEIKKINLKGIYLSRERNRYFPQESLASKVVGFVDQDLHGRYGLEEHYNDLLSEQENLTLTIDYNIQFAAEKLLTKAQDELNIEGGEIIVLDPVSGGALAMADFPNFNPNQYREYAKTGNLEIFQNDATQKIFEPGSVFKPITVAAGLEEGKITPQTKYVDTGEVKVGGYTVSNYGDRVYGEQTMTNVLEKSINTGAVFVEKQLGHNLFLEYIETFGLFEKTGLDLPETYSENKEFKKGYEINFSTASFGQGIEITPIQLVRAYSAIANGGKLIRPFAAKQNIEEETAKEVISSKTASQITAMLLSAVENGFGKAARIPGYYIAGKTGTAQVSFPSLGIQKRGYSDKTIQTFIGFFPAFNPRFLILVKLDNPETKTAEYSAAPVFKELAKYIIDYYQIPPDYE